MIPFAPDWTCEPEQLLEINLQFPYSAAEWDQIFTTFIELLDHKDVRISDRAIDRLISAVEQEASQHSNDKEYLPKSTDERFREVLEAIAHLIRKTPRSLEQFCQKVQFLAKEEPYKQCVLNWLSQLINQLEDIEEDANINSSNPEVPVTLTPSNNADAASADNSPSKQPTTLTPEAVLSARIFLGAYDSSWQAFGPELLNLLDHQDLLIRACAAHQIGQFCRQAIQNQFSPIQYPFTEEDYRRNQQAIAGMPSYEIFFDLTKSKEIERPGIAGAFWDATTSYPGFDWKNWLLDILEQSPNPEPYLPYFPCNLAFDAHEKFDQDVDAIQRLIKMGRTDIAISAATEAAEKVDELQPLLMELGYKEDSLTIRLASWHLAYYYHVAHPNGIEQGYVEWINDLADIDLFLLFSVERDRPTPYAAVIYGKDSNGPLPYKTAQRWVNQIFPKAVRGMPRRELEYLTHTLYQWYAKGYVQYVVANEKDYSTRKTVEPPEFVDNVIIGYRSDQPWNPKVFFSA
ncbi:MAG: hypothetical protein AAGD25_18095 [Cyanobacteria bacterium P01_F01_bin.150]